MPCWNQDGSDSLVLVQDDAHIFCRESQVRWNFCSLLVLLFWYNIFCLILPQILQIKEEVKGVLEFISYVYKVFGFTFDLKLSTV